MFVGLAVQIGIGVRQLKDRGDISGRELFDAKQVTVAKGHGRYLF